MHDGNCALSVVNLHIGPISLTVFLYTTLAIICRTPCLMNLKKKSLSIWWIFSQVHTLNLFIPPTDTLHWRRAFYPTRSCPPHSPPQPLQPQLPAAHLPPPHPSIKQAGASLYTIWHLTLKTVSFGNFLGPLELCKVSRLFGTSPHQSAKVSALSLWPTTRKLSLQYRTWMDLHWATEYYKCRLKQLDGSHNFCYYVIIERHVDTRC